MKLSTIFLILTTLAAAASCSIAPNGTQIKQESSKLRHNLNEKEAQRRFKQLRGLQYNISLKLDKSKIYSGTVESIFNFNLGHGDLRVDFYKGTITYVMVNNQKIKDFVYNGFFITINEKHFKEGKNVLKVAFEHGYSNAGEAFSQFIDPVDEEIYTFTDLEPYKANEWLPIFDQPDLKARYQMEVLAPEAWEVISNTSVKSRKKIGSNKLWKFHRTKAFSSYLLHLSTGPYILWKDNYKNIPLKIYTRKSLKKYADPKNWFKLTKQGFKYFEDFFDMPYPFGKYDQILVPNFNWGGMENVGAVTYKEEYWFRGKPTKAERIKRAEVILHELAHMWFGNIVTMKWWNGLWLNESFASFVSYKALVEATEFKDAWMHFNMRMKRWAYHTDQLRTTHPIETPVKNTEEAFSNLDGITYGKGASVLRQLEYFVGAQTFKKGVQYYFKKHQFSNTKLEDLISAIEIASGEDLSQWKRDWLEKPGTNIIQVLPNCSDGYLKELVLDQNYNKDTPYRRSHLTKIGLFKDHNQTLQFIGDVPTKYSAAQTKIEIKEKVLCPDVISPNHEDFDFVSVRLDPKTLKYVLKNIDKIEDPHSRLMFWNALWGMVNRSELMVTDFINFVFKQLPKEKDFNVAHSSMKKLSIAYDYVYKAREKNESAKYFSRSVENFVWNQLVSGRYSQDVQKSWFDTFVKIASSKTSLSRLEGLLSKKRKINGLEIDQKRKWQVLLALSSFHYGKIDSFVKKEKKNDQSSLAKKYLLAISASKPDKKTKEVWFKKILKKDSPYNSGELTLVMSSLFPRNQKFYHRELLSQIFNNLEAIDKSKNQHFVEKYIQNLIPLLCHSVAHKNLKTYINEKVETMSHMAIKELRDKQQLNEQCENIMNFAELRI